MSKLVGRLVVGFVGGVFEEKVNACLSFSPLSLEKR
jgi:hypothetical protein